MKIAVVGTRGFPGIQGGIESHCEHLYSHLVDRGCDVTVFTRKPYVTYQEPEYKGIKLVPLDCPRNKFLETIVHTFKGIVQSRMLGPDVLHIHAIGPSLFAPLARLFGMKVVVTNHGPDYKRKKWSVPAKLFLKLCERIGCAFANEIITIAKNISDNIRDQYGCESTVIPNGVVISPKADTDASLKHYGLKRQRYILSVGRFVPEKGFDDLMEAFKNVRQEHLNSGENPWKLVIIGDADHDDTYSRSLKVKGNANHNVIMTGFLTGKPLHELFSHAGLFVLPSYYEGLPIVLLEAMSYGLSCIASDIAANRCVPLSSDRFFPAGNIKELTDRIREFVNKRWNSESEVNQIRMIQDNFNWGKIADKTLEIYRHAAS